MFRLNRNVVETTCIEFQSGSYSVRRPEGGEHLTTENGTVWLVEAVTAAAELALEGLDPDYYVVDLVPAIHATNPRARCLTLDNAGFEIFCRELGIKLK